MKKKTVRNSAFDQYDSNDPRFVPHLDPDSSPKKGGAGAGAGTAAGNQLLTSTIQIRKTVRNSAFHQYDSNEPQFVPHLDPDSSPKKGGAGAGAGAGATAGNQLLTSF